MTSSMPAILRMVADVLRASRHEFDREPLASRTPAYLLAIVEGNMRTAAASGERAAAAEPAPPPPREHEKELRAWAHYIETDDNPSGRFAAAARMRDGAAEIERLTRALADAERERDEARRSCAAVCEEKARLIVAQDIAATSAIDAARAEIAALREALTCFTEFAWTAVTADCEEAHAYLNSKIDYARAILSRPTITALDGGKEGGHV